MEQNKVTSFRGRYRFLSNFHACTVYLFGIKFGSTETAYVAAKVAQHLPWIRERVARLSASDAKKFGREEFSFDDESPENQKIIIRPDWTDNMRLAIMRILLFQKFHPIFNPELAEGLMDTGSMELIEGNTWGDRFFGVFEGEGENNLGKLLMERRTELLLEKNRFLSYGFTPDDLLIEVLSGSSHFNEMLNFYTSYKNRKVTLGNTLIGRV